MKHKKLKGKAYIKAKSEKKRSLEVINDHSYIRGAFSARFTSLKNMEVICTLCNRSFANKHSLSNHKYRFHSTDPRAIESLEHRDVQGSSDMEEGSKRTDLDLKNRKEQKLKKAGGFISEKPICPLCYKSFGTKHSLSTHKYRYHSKNFIRYRNYTGSRNLKSLKRKKRTEGIFKDLLWIYELFMEKDFKELDQSINELRNAASAILLVFKYEEQEPKEKHLLRDLTETSISKGRDLLKQYYMNLKNVFMDLDRDKIIKLFKDIQNEVIILDPIVSKYK